MSKIIKEIQTSIPMPKTISIGDPLYFEQYKDQPQRLAQLVYQGSFRRPSWKAAVKLVQTEETCQLPLPSDGVAMEGACRSPIVRTPGVQAPILN